MELINKMRTIVKNAEKFFTEKRDTIIKRTELYLAESNKAKALNDTCRMYGELWDKESSTRHAVSLTMMRLMSRHPELKEEIIEDLKDSGKLLNVSDERLHEAVWEYPTQD